MRAVAGRLAAKSQHCVLSLVCQNLSVASGMLIGNACASSQPVCWTWAHVDVHHSHKYAILLLPLPSCQRHVALTCNWYGD